MFKINRIITKVVVAAALLTAFDSQAANLCNQVFSGNIERIRTQVQASGETVMRVYLHPGNNADYAGYVTSDMMAKVLMAAKNKDVAITGYSDSSCKITWVDYR